MFDCSAVSWELYSCSFFISKNATNDKSKGCAYVDILYTCMMVIIMLMEHPEPRPHAGIRQCEFWRIKYFLWRRLDTSKVQPFTIFCFHSSCELGHVRIFQGWEWFLSCLLIRHAQLNVNHLNCSRLIYDCLRNYILYQFSNFWYLYVTFNFLARCICNSSSI